MLSVISKITDEPQDRVIVNKQLLEHKATFRGAARTNINELSEDEDLEEEDHQEGWSQKELIETPKQKLLRQD